MNGHVSATIPPNEYIIKTKEWIQTKLRLPLLIFLIINLCLAIVVTAILLGMPYFTSDNTSSLCLTEQCVLTASSVIKAMDKKADPCRDFYQYACGGWIKSNPMPDWASDWDRMRKVAEVLQQDVRQLLEKGDEIVNGNYTEPHSVRKARSLYRTCMNTEALESKGLVPIEQTLKAVGLPSTVPNVNPDDTFDWLYTIVRARRMLGINLLVSLNVGEDVRNSSVFKIVIEQVSPGFGEKYLLQAEKFPKEIKNYKKYITQMLKAYSNFSEADKFSEDIVNFSTQIAKVMTPSEIRRSTQHLFHEVTLVELAKGPNSNNTNWKYFNWTRCMNLLFNDTVITVNHTSDRAIVLDLPYVEKLSTLLSTANRLSLQRFLWWNVFSMVAPLTSAKFRTLGFEFSQQLLGLQARTPRWKGCTTSVNLNFGLAVSYLYVKSHFDKGHTDKAIKMIKDVQEAFESTVHNQDWMDSVTREKTLTKLHAIRAFVGYPGWIMNATQLDAYYNKAHVIEGDLFKTFLNLTYASVKKGLGRLRSKPDRSRWVASATTVNAFYSATLNSITFPTGILAPPFYGNGIDAIDYGSIGAIMGHEITHGFDEQGRRYDENGNLKQWWTTATLNHYHERLGCIIKQYNNYTMPEFDQSLHINGVNTQGENIADNGGLRAAFEGYKRRKAVSNSMHRRLPGLSDVSTDQLFFLGFAQTWCGNYTRESLKNTIVNGVHSPNRIRVLGTLANSKEFAEAWNCPIGTPMNPEQKCILW